jgi:hypothetical protein
MREWIVMLRARSSVRLTGKDILNIEARPASTEPVVAVRLRNAFAEVDGRLIFTGLIAEARGLAEEPADAVALLSPLAAPHLQVVATAANAAVDEPSRMLIYAPPTGDEPGRFLEQRSVGEPLPATTVRAIHVSDLGAVHQGLEDHSDKARLHRSMAHYRQAVRLLDPFNRVMTAQHLWMACENLGQVIFRRLCQEADLPVSDNPRRMGEHKHQLAVAAGFNPIGQSRQHLYDFDAHIRVEHIFGGDRETYKQLRDASDAFEHGYADFGEVHAAVHGSADTALRLVRNAILREIALPVDSPLLGEKYEHPLEGWQPTFQMAGTYASDRDDDWPYFYGPNLMPEIVAIEEVGDEQRNVTFRANASGASLLEGQRLSVQESSFAVPLTPDRKAAQIGDTEVVVTHGDQLGDEE